MDDHVGAVGKLMFINEGEKLLSCSADRTVVIRGPEGISNFETQRSMVERYRMFESSGQSVIDTGEDHLIRRQLMR
jgi:hypothetical protein